MEKKFTTRWFDVAKPNWDALLPLLKPKRILEIGSFEGQSSCYAISSTSCEHITCIDTWKGGVEHSSVDMNDVETTFDSNVKIAIQESERCVELKKIKSESAHALAKLVSDGMSCKYDFVYVDGSHQAPDVLTDAVLAFKLCRVGGIIGFDDYLWNEKLNTGVDPIRAPKLAIDTFTTIFSRKLQIIRNIPLYQVYVQKTEH